MPNLRAYVRAHVGASIFVASLGVSAVLHVGLLPVARPLPAAHVTRALGAILTGRIIIDRIHRLGFTHLDGIDAHVDDKDGTRLLDIKGLNVRVSTFALFRSLWNAHEPLT